MNLRDLQYLIALCEKKHFGKAANACHVSQPTLSTQIKKLEEELGVTLVERDNKHVLLTDIGKEVVAAARQVLAHVDNIKHIALQACNPESGSFALGVIPTIAPHLLPYAVKAIKSRFANLQLSLKEAKTADLITMLQNGSIDAAIMALPVNAERLEHHFMYKEAFFAALPAMHPLSKKERITVADLKPYPLMLLEDGHCLRDQALDICHAAGTTEAAGFRATSLETLRQMVISGAGVTLLPTLAAEADAEHHSDIAIVPFAEPMPWREVAIFYRSMAVQKTMIKTIADTISARLPKGLSGYLRVGDISA